MKQKITIAIMLGLSSLMMVGCESNGKPDKSSGSAHGQISETKGKTAQSKWEEGRKRREAKRKAWISESRARRERWFKPVRPN